MLTHVTYQPPQKQVGWTFLFASNSLWNKKRPHIIFHIQSFSIEFTSLRFGLLEAIRWKCSQLALHEGWASQESRASFMGWDHWGPHAWGLLLGSQHLKFFIHRMSESVLCKWSLMNNGACPGGLESQPLCLPRHPSQDGCSGTSSFPTGTLGQASPFLPALTSDPMSPSTSFLGWGRPPPLLPSTSSGDLGMDMGVRGCERL